MSIAQYMIVEAHSVYRLTDDVHKYLADGWQLQGGISVAVIQADMVHRGATIYAQAMIKEQAEPKAE